MTVIKLVTGYDIPFWQYSDHVWAWDKSKTPTMNKSRLEAGVSPDTLFWHVLDAIPREHLPHMYAANTSKLPWQAPVG